MATTNGGIATLAPLADAQARAEIRAERQRNLLVIAGAALGAVLLNALRQAVGPRF